MTIEIRKPELEAFIRARMSSGAFKDVEDLDFERDPRLWPRRCVMSGFLLDTNNASELTRQKSAPQVERWLDEANDEELHLAKMN